MRASRTDPDSTTADSLAAGILAAWAAMFVRVMITVAIVRRELLGTLALEFGALALTATILTGIFYLRGLRRRTPVGAENLPVSNPFSLSSAVQFALLFAVVLVVVKLTQEYAPVGGLYVVAAVAGLADVHAITLSMAQNASNGLSNDVATIAIGIAALSNTVVKCGMVVVLGRGPVRTRLVLATGILIGCGLLVSLLLH